MPNKLSAILLVTLAATAVTGAYFTSALLFGTRTIPNQGNVNAINVGAYWEYSCTNPVTIIDWDYIEPGTSKDVTIYIRNEGTIPMTLNVTTGNWSPSNAAAYMTLSWNREAYVLNAQGVVSARLTLSVSSTISQISNFSFDITVTGTE